jgi:hypothetical protein
MGTAGKSAILAVLTYGGTSTPLCSTRSEGSSHHAGEMLTNWRRPTSFPEPRSPASSCQPDEPLLGASRHDRNGWRLCGGSWCKPTFCFSIPTMDWSRHGGEARARQCPGKLPPIGSGDRSTEHRAGDLPEIQPAQEARQGAAERSGDRPGAAGHPTDQRALLGTRCALHRPGPEPGSKPYLSLNIPKAPPDPEADRKAKAFFNRMMPNHPMLQDDD